MPLPRVVARFNRKVTNPILARIAWWMPGFALLTHVGRVSGTVRRTPINIFRRGDRYVIALTYGADSQWVKNVMAAGGCEVRTHGRTVRLCEPRVFTDPDHRLVPGPVRVALRILDVDDFVSMRPAPTQSK